MKFLVFAFLVVFVLKIRADGKRAGRKSLKICLLYSLIEVRQNWKRRYSADILLACERESEWVTWEKVRGKGLEKEGARTGQRSETFQAPTRPPESRWTVCCCVSVNLRAGRGLVLRSRRILAAESQQMRSGKHYNYHRKQYSAALGPEKTVIYSPL